MMMIDLVGFVLAWAPFRDPMPWVHDWWYLLFIPLAFGVSLTYKALRQSNVERVWSQALLMTAQVVLAMIALAIVLAVFILWVIPMLPVE